MITVTKGDFDTRTIRSDLPHYSRLGTSAAPARKASCSDEAFVRVLLKRIPCGIQAGCRVETAGRFEAIENHAQKCRALLWVARFIEHPAPAHRPDKRVITLEPVHHDAYRMQRRRPAMR